jgi:hypothetical protein
VKLQLLVSPQIFVAVMVTVVTEPGGNVLPDGGEEPTPNNPQGSDAVTGHVRTTGTQELVAMLGGQATLGGVVSVIVTTSVQVLVAPLHWLVALHTCVAMVRQPPPLVVVETIPTTTLLMLHWYIAEGVSKVQGEPHCTVLAVTQFVKIGALVSSTVTYCVQTPSTVAPAQSYTVEMPW